MRVDLWELGPACNVFFFGIPISHHRTWNTVVIQETFGSLDDKLEASVFQAEEITLLLAMMLLSLVWFSQGSVFSWGEIIFRSMDGIDHYIVIVLFHLLSKQSLCVMIILILFILLMISKYCVSQNCETLLWVVMGLTYKQDLCIFWRCWGPQRRWDLLTSVRAEGLLRAERIKRREVLCTAGEIRRTPEKLHFEQSFGYKEMELGGDWEWGRYTKRQQQDW